MKSTTWLALAALVGWSAVAIAEPLNDKSKAPDWGRASQAEKDAWITAFQFKNCLLYNLTLPTILLV